MPIRVFMYLTLSFLVWSCTSNRSLQDDGTAERALLELQDRVALKALVDRFSVLADRRDVAGQLLLFTDTATVTSYRDGIVSSQLTGKAEIGSAFVNFLGLFDTVYHLNGQQTVALQGDRASGTAYCLVVLIGEQDGQRIRTTFGVRYEDNYVKRDDRWLINERKSYFNWQDVRPVD